MEASCSSSHRRPTVTVAICTFNRAHLLNETLLLLSTIQAPPSIDWEVVVVDNASTDGTGAVLERYSQQPRFRTFYEGRRGLSNARNRCVDEAHGDWLLFTDDDVRVSRNWIEEFVLAIERHPEASVAGGPIEPWFPEPPDSDLLATFPELRTGFCGLDHGQPERLLAPRSEVYGANFAVRRSVFDHVRFDPTLGVPFGLGEETDLVSRVRAAGGAVLWIPTIPVQHYVDPSRTTLRYLRRYRATQGASQIRREGLSPTATVFQMPRWLVRRWAMAYLSSLAWRLRGNRRRALHALRESCFCRGMLREARILSMTSGDMYLQSSETERRDLDSSSH
jgi:GT2 family glycosyltransferase